MTRGVRAQGAQEINPAEGRPVGIAEVELRVRALPQQESAQPLLPRGPDHQVGIGLAGRVQMVGDVLHVEDLGELLDAGALGGVVVEQGTDGVRDLTPAAVPDGDVHQQARVGRGRLGGVLERPRRLRREQVERPDRLDVPALGDQPLHGGFDDPQQGLDLGNTGGEKGFAKDGPISFETQWFDWGEYAASMVSRIRVNWYNNMPQLIQTGLKGVVTIRFTIQRDGRITDETRRRIERDLDLEEASLANREYRTLPL